MEYIEIDEKNKEKNTIILRKTEKIKRNAIDMENDEFD